MKRFRFRLATVLRVRRVQEDQARAALLAAHRDASQAGKAVTDALLAYSATPSLLGSHGHDDFERARFRLEHAAGAVEFTRFRQRVALDLVEERRTEWMATHQRVAALERLETRRRGEHALEEQRAEDRVMDEIVVARHAMNTAARDATDRAARVAVYSAAQRTQDPSPTNEGAMR